MSKEKDGAERTAAGRRMRNGGAIHNHSLLQKPLELSLLKSCTVIHELLT